MTKLYTIEELLHENISQNTPTDFLKNEGNIQKYISEVFGRLATGEYFDNVNKLDIEQKKQYEKDVRSTIYNPDILKYIWNYRLEVMNNNNVDEYVAQKYISEVLQYILVYMKEIKLIEISEQKNSNIKPDFDLNHNWVVKAQTVIAKIKMDLENLYIKNLLPNTLFTTETNDGLGLLITGLRDGHYDEVNTDDILNQIGIKVNSEELMTKNSR